jgi:apolipoprotein N-acyltransferase
MKTEPVLTAAGLSGFVMAFFAMAVAMGWIQLSDAQMQSVQAVVIPLAVFIVPLLAAWWARGRVTPTAKLFSGETIQTATGEPAVLVPAAQAQMLGIVPLGDK